MISHRTQTTTILLTLMGFVGVALVVLALHVYHFRGANYRDDEIRTVHAGSIMSPREVVLWMSNGIHPPLWRVSATTWVSLFGPSESATRWLSSLYSVLVLALMFRLGRDLFDTQTGLFAALILGTHALFMFYGHELRPYSLLIFWVAGLHLTFTRWLRQPGFKYALLYVICGVGALYTHFFSMYVIGAQVVAFVLLTRWQPGLYLRAVGLWVAIGLAFTGWMPAFLHGFLVSRPGGIDYGIEAELVNVRLIYTYIQMQPYSLGNLLIPAALLIPVRRVLPERTFNARVFRFGWSSIKWYFAVSAGFIVVASFATDRVISVLTDRNLLTAVLALAMLAAFAIRALPVQMRVIVVPLLIYSGLTNFQRYERGEPFRQELAFIAPTYETGDPIIISVDNGLGAYFSHAYYLLNMLPERVTRDDFFYLTEGKSRLNLPEQLDNVIRDDSPESLARFHDLIDGQARVWLVTSDSQSRYAEVYLDALTEAFTLARSETIDDLERYKRAYTFSEYVRNDK